MPSASLAPPTANTSQATWLTDLLAALPAPSGPQASLQAEARAQLAACGLPNRRHEDWRFTSLDALRALDPASLAQPPAAAEVAAWPAPGAAALQIGRAHV